MQEGITPLEVMLDNMRFFHRDAEKIVARILTPDLAPELAAELLKQAIAARAAADTSAKNAAPYCHPRLGSGDARISVSLPPIVTAGDCATAAGRVVGLVASGEITPADGQALANIIDAQRRAIEVHDHEKRIMALEGRTQ